MSETPNTDFSERDFYLREFAGRTLAVVVPHHPDLARPAVQEALDALRGGGVRVLLIGADSAALAERVRGPIIEASAPRLEGDLWRAFRADPIQAVLLPGDALATQVRALCMRLGLFKVVWLDAEGGLHSKGGDRLKDGDRHQGGDRQSFVHLEELREFVAAGGADPQRPDRNALWTEVIRLLEAGIPNVNVCSADDLAHELLTYSGRGTLFTRDRYIQVRRLGLDDYDAAHDLFRRGVSEGYLAPRDDEAVDQILASAIGAFVEGRDLAGIGALLRWGDVGEIGSLYTLTRFLGEGVGEHLVRFAVEHAAEHGMKSVFACTTTPRVGEFFERQGFASISSEKLPPDKWADYDPARRAMLHCYERVSGALES